MVGDGENGEGLLCWVWKGEHEATLALANLKQWPTSRYNYFLTPTAPAQMSSPDGLCQVHFFLYLEAKKLNSPHRVHTKRVSRTPNLIRTIHPSPNLPNRSSEADPFLSFSYSFMDAVPISAAYSDWKNSMLWRYFYNSAVLYQYLNHWLWAMDNRHTLG